MRIGAKVWGRRWTRDDQGGEEREQGRRGEKMTRKGEEDEEEGRRA